MQGYVAGTCHEVKSHVYMSKLGQFDLISGYMSWGQKMVFRKSKFYQS